MLRPRRRSTCATAGVMGGERMVFQGAGWIGSQKGEAVVLSVACKRDFFPDAFPPVHRAKSAKFAKGSHKWHKKYIRERCENVKSGTRKA